MTRIDMTMNRNRIAYVDVMKGFAMIAVVLLHIDFSFPKNDFVNTYSLLGGLWHVAVFFMISGFFLNVNKMSNTKSFLKERVLKLYLKTMYIYIPLVLLHNFLLTHGFYYYGFKYRHGFMHEYSFMENLMHIVSQFLFFWREPYAGAMWYVDSLIISLVLLSVFYHIATRLNKFGKERELFVGVFVISIACITTLLSNAWHLDIPKINSSCSAMLLVFVGHLLFSTMGGTVFENKKLLFCSLLIFYQYTLLSPNVSLSNNHFRDLIHLCAAPISALIIVGYISRLICCNWVGKIVGYIGRKSFYVMGLHMVGFHVLTKVLELSSIIPVASAHSQTPSLGRNVLLLCIYCCFAIGFSLLVPYLISVFHLKVKYAVSMHGHL